MDKDSVKPPPAVEETYRGVAAPSRPKVGDAAPIEEMPKVCLPACQSELPCPSCSHLLATTRAVRAAPDPRAQEAAARVSMNL